jgi:hypothetical protein
MSEGAQARRSPDRQRRSIGEALIARSVFTLYLVSGILLP